MTEPVPEEKLIRNVSDTALWAAVYRAEENERPTRCFATHWRSGLPEIAARASRRR